MLLRLGYFHRIDEMVPSTYFSRNFTVGGGKKRRSDNPTTNEFKYSIQNLVFPNVPP